MKPAEQLVGKTLPNGWTVIREADRRPSATGGRFSHGYICRNESGREAYLKAMDYTEALQSPDPAASLHAMTEAYLYEKNVCERCRDRRLRRVVHAIEAGTLRADPSNPAGTVEYLIFELADGDIRAHLDSQQQFDVAFALRMLHNVSTGLQQLHSLAVAHQDLKPSNILVFDRKESKVADLGRSSSRDTAAPHDIFQIAGDRTYAPPELLYGHVSQDWNQRRLGCDLYHLGSLCVFTFARVHTNAILYQHMASEHQWQNWSGSYDQVLPYIRVAFDKCLTDIRSSLPPAYSADVEQIIRHLCEPDPTLRGHPMNRQGHLNHYGLERFVSGFDLLARRAEYNMVDGR
jgi:eukaryotic-like serine/threonine-protein kinase